MYPRDRCRLVRPLEVLALIGIGAGFGDVPHCNVSKILSDGTFRKDRGGVCHHRVPFRGAPISGSRKRAAGGGLDTRFNSGCCLGEASGSRLAVAVTKAVVRGGGGGHLNPFVTRAAEEARLY